MRTADRRKTNQCQQTLPAAMTEPASTSSGSAAVAEKRCEESKEDEVFPKKPRLEACDRDDTENKLEARLGGILCCAVCLDLPRSAVYQVSAFSHVWEGHCLGSHGITRSLEAIMSSRSVIVVVKCV